MSSVPVITLFLCLGFCGCVQIEDDIFLALMNRLASLEEKVHKQEKINNNQEERIRLLLQQNGELLASIQSQGRTISELGSSNTSGARKRFVMDSEGPVAFSAIIIPTVIEHTKPNTAIKFETILTEYGGGYNNDTGIFVVPHTGLYLLSCSLLDHMSHGNHAGGVMVHGEIMRNHDVLARVFAHAEATYRDQGANTIIVKLNAGDQVWVRTMDQSDLGLGGEMYTSFSGYLLWQLG